VGPRTASVKYCETQYIVRRDDFDGTNINIMSEPTD
jgi:hypothetical protein